MIKLRVLVKNRRVPGFCAPLVAERAVRAGKKKG
jgi:hypothetical protein